MHPARRKDLKLLIDIYALRTRRLLAAVSVLGALVSAEGEIDETITEIKTISRLVEEAGAELFAFVGQRLEESSDE